MNNGMNYLPFVPDMAMEYAQGQKRVTRRVVTRLDGIGRVQGVKRAAYCQWVFASLNPFEVRKISAMEAIERAPYKVGETVGLLTTWAVNENYDHLRPLQLDPDIPILSYFENDLTNDDIKYRGRLRPGRFMPLFLRHKMPRARIASVGIEHVQEIDDNDAWLEGFDSKGAFVKKWDEINKKRGYGWDENPAVLRYRVKPV